MTSNSNKGDGGALVVVLILLAVLGGVFVYFYKPFTSSSTKTSIMSKPYKKKCPKARGVDAWDDECKYVTACDLDTGYRLTSNKKACECDSSRGYKDNGKKCECDSQKGLKEGSLGNCETIVLNR